MSEQLPETTRTPIPDPTLLTTQQLYREIASLQSVLETRLLAVADKMNSMEGVLTSKLDERINHLQGLHEEKFQSIQVQFQERDVRTEQTSRDSKVAVDAALQAAKEAVGEQNKSSSLAISKSEAATNKQIDQLGLMITTTTAGLNDKIEDLKERMGRAEGHGGGMQSMWGYGFAVLMLIVAICAVVAAFLKK
jgi:hypothetical protein